MARPSIRLLRGRGPYAKLIVLGVWFAVIKLLATLAFHSPSDSIYDISFGFGGYVEGLLTEGRFQGCTDDFCTEAARMPALPLFFAAIGLVSKNLLVAALVKTVLTTVAAMICFRYLLRQQMGAAERKAWVWFVLIGIVAFSPTVIKHITTVHYEEGFLIEILFLWAFAFLVALRQWADRDATPAHGVITLALALSGLAYLFKSSMIAVLALTLVLAAAVYLRARARNILIVAALCVAAVAGWGVRNAVTTDHFSIMTSFDGQNAYRGLNTQGEQIYPQLYLDRLFDEEIAYLPDGRAVTLPPLPPMESFSDEWAQDAYYKEEAKEWPLDHPSLWLKYTGKKALNFFVDIRKTPYTYENDARDLSMGAGDLLIMLWLFVGRILEVLMLGLLVVVWRRRERTGRWLCGGVVAVNAAYAAPYLAGFNYERHVTTYLVIVIACVGVLLTELWERRASTTYGSEDS